MDPQGQSALLGESLLEGFGSAQMKNGGSAGPWLDRLCNSGEASRNVI